MIGQCNVAAAVAVASYDLAQNETWNISSRRRVIRGISIVGGNAINEATIDLMVENVRVGSFNNTRNGVVAALQEDRLPLGAINVPAGSKISLIVRVAPTVSPIVTQIF